MRNNKDNDNLVSLQSNEHFENDPRFIQVTHDKSQKDEELNDLINELNEEEPRKKANLNKISFINDTTLEPTYVNQEKLISHDSFEDLMDEFGDENKPDKPPGMAKVEFVNKKTDEDEFGF